LHYLDAPTTTEINSRAFVVHLAHPAAQLYNLDGDLSLHGHACEVGDASEDRRHFPARRCADRTTLCGIMAIIGGCDTVPVRPWA
jgi:hypothetical protein